jgi:glycosyltransferase involved in cell wall biosynthesis
MRPKVSVCMAAYNGDRFIEQQLRSILPQLSPEDEIVIVDDASTDRTTDVIRSLHSPLIRLICHPHNRGVVATFEEALRNATGDILFLCDGDDIWAKDKVDQFLRAFGENPAADLVTSHISFIDGNGNPIETDLYRHRKVFKPGFWANLLHNHYQGSAMALRASRLHSVLPFPRDVLFLHDHWIGMRNILAGGSAICLEQPLLFYRRHGQNLSGRFSRGKQIKLRLQLLRTHLIAALHDRA